MLCLHDHGSKKLMSCMPSGRYICFVASSLLS